MMGYGLVGFAQRQSAQEIALALRQQGEQSIGTSALLSTDRETTIRNCPPDGRQQHDVVEGLFQKIYRTGLHRPYGQPYVRIAGHNDQRQTHIASGKFFLKIEPAHAGHVYVHDQAVAGIR